MPLEHVDVPPRADTTCPPNCGSGDGASGKRGPPDVRGDGFRLGRQADVPADRGRAVLAVRPWCPLHPRAPLPARATAERGGFRRSDPPCARREGRRPVRVGSDPWRGIHEMPSPAGSAAPAVAPSPSDGDGPEVLRGRTVRLAPPAAPSPRNLAWPAGEAAGEGDEGVVEYGRDAVDQGEGLGDVVDVGRSDGGLQREAAPVADQVVLAARPSPVDRRRAGVGAPFSPGYGSRRCISGTSPARRPRSARRAGSGAAGRRSRPAATAQAAAGTSDPSRTPAPAAAVARRGR